MLNHVTALHICSGVAPGLSAQDMVNALVERAFKPCGGSKCKVLYPSAMAIFIHLVIVPLEACLPF